MNIKEAVENLREVMQDEGLKIILKKVEAVEKNDKVNVVLTCKNEKYSFKIENKQDLIQQVEEIKIKENFIEALKENKMEALKKYIVNYDVFYIYDFISAMEFIKINSKSITILDALNNKKYISIDTFNNFSVDGFRISKKK